MILTNYDIAVIGAGPAGLTAAVALARAGCRTVLAGPRFNPHPSRPDTRTTALLRASVQMLRNLDVWERCQGDAAPLLTIRIIDDTGRLFRAPEVVFHCQELGGEPFGYNIPNTALVAALLDRARNMNNLTLIETAGATGLELGDAEVIITLAEGQSLTACLVAGADGRNSLCRKTAGLATRSWQYPQMALAFNFDHSEPHHGASNEFHANAGPFTTVPLPGLASSLVWVTTPQQAKRLMSMDSNGIATAIEDRLQGCLGRVSDVGPRATFPLSGMSVERYTAHRVALVGEAAHVIPPIGAQGLNLSFRDAATLAEYAGAALEQGDDPGGRKTLRAYDRARRADIFTRTVAVDLLNRSLLTGFLPLQVARGIGLHLLAGIAPLRRFFMREGLAPQTGLPKLMQAPAQTKAMP
jgi:2-octaprenyl-6-methoxyphenol hydroxylase